jgi:hypothetical protein
MSWVLVIYIYAGVWAKGDSVTITHVPMLTQELCEEAGKQLDSLVQGTAKEVRYLCLKNTTR